MIPKNPQLTCRLDYISITNFYESLEECEVAISGVAVFVPDGDRWGALENRYQFRSVAGLKGWIKRSDHLYHLRLELPGEFCQQVDQLPLCQYLASNEFRCTRLDIALDDYKRRVSFETVKAAGDGGYYRLVEKFRSIQSAVKRGADIVGTCYFGNSDKIIRFYNAQAVHGIEAERWELQLRSDIAQSAFDTYLNEPDCLSSLVVGAVDFGISGNHYDDFQRFHWWQELIDVAGQARSVPRKRFEPDISKTVHWLNLSVAPSLALLKEGLGSQFDELMSHLCCEGHQRLKPYHKQMIETLKESGIDVFTFL